MLYNFERDGIFVFILLRKVNGWWIVCYDDCFIIKFVVEIDGIVVLNDNFRDLVRENFKW